MPLLIYGERDDDFKDCSQRSLYGKASDMQQYRAFNGQDSSLPYHYLLSEQVSLLLDSISVDLRCRLDKNVGKRYFREKHLKNLICNSPSRLMKIFLFIGLDSLELY